MGICERDHGLGQGLGQYWRKTLYSNFMNNMENVIWSLALSAQKTKKDLKNK